MPTHAIPSWIRSGLLAGALILIQTPVFGADALEAGFLSPPDSARPQTWWHWMNGNITREGITADLEAMKDIGLGGAQIFNVDEGIPAGPVKFNSPEWHELFKYTVAEADRLGLQLCIHNCAGWSSSGGPWNTPEHAMQRVVTSEVRVQGPARFNEVLPQPPVTRDFYRDIAVLAFKAPPTENVKMRAAAPAATTSTGDAEAANLCDGNDDTVVHLPPPSRGKPQWVQLEFYKPFAAHTIRLVATRETGECTGNLQVSDDGRSFRAVRDIHFTSRGPRTLQLSLGAKPVTSRFWRVQFNSMGRGAATLALAEIELVSPFLIENIDAKDGLNGNQVSSSPAADAVEGVAISPNGIVDMTKRVGTDGRLQWKVPRGEWIILRLGYTPTGRENHPAPPEGTGLECDKLSREALDAHWAGFMQKVIEDAGLFAGRSFNNALIDSYEVGGQNWDAGFRGEFKKRRGYDPVPFLPTFTGRLVGSPEISERFLWDVRRTIADLFAENYYGHFAELCHEHGLLASIEPYSGPFESLQSGQPADLVMGEFWAGSRGNPWVKLAASVAHIYGKPIVGAESFTASPGGAGRWQDDPWSLKPLGDLMFCTGLNRYIFHRYAMQPWTNRWPGMTMGQWGFHFERTETWWKQGKAWIDYVSRCQFLLQQGRFVADAAYFCGESAPVDMRVGNPPLPPGYDYDAINADVLLHRATVNNGRLRLPDGVSYTVLVLPPDDTDLTPQLLERIRALTRDGLTVVGARPQHSPSLENYPKCDRQVKSLAAGLWGKCNGTNVTENTVGRGRVVWGKSLAEVFTARELKPDFEFTGDSTDTKLVYCHRVAGDADIYFISNQRRQFDSADCTFRVAGKSPELWHPDTGVIEPAPVWSESDGRTTVRLQFDPAGSVFVVFRAKAQGDHLVAIQHDGPLVAGEGTKPAELHILKATYGVSLAWLDVTAKVKSLVSAGTRQIAAGNDLVGDDPASGVVKRLRVEFVLDGRQQAVEANEGQTLELPAGSEVVKALYGHLPGSDPHWLDVTAKVKSLVAGGMRQISAGNHLAADDPAPNLVKQLRVTFRLNGRLWTAEAPEGEMLDVPADAEVEKALYGRLPVQAPGPVLSVDLTAKLDALVKNGQLSVQVGNGLVDSDPAPFVPKELRVEYVFNGVIKQTANHEGEMITLPEAMLATHGSPVFDLVIGPDGQTRVRTRTPGTFVLTWASGRKTEVQCRSVPVPVEISGEWQLNFPPDWGAPPEVTLDRLIPWTDHTNEGVRYFSGTAKYQKEIEISGELIGSGRELWLDLGTVKNFAEVSLNGRPLGTLWKPPFCVNLTGVAQAGTNRLEVKVTNLWPNRLIGDEQLPDDREWSGKHLKAWPQWLLEGKPSPTGRFTFTTWHHWTKNDAPLESGLLGPVTLSVVETVVAN
jgi:hypothetical protein